ncbi:MAG: YigZ family protein, partial [Proteobacteria bacterium]|nr:YigZ family protein [Pseudomonadota bacterium]
MVDRPSRRAGKGPSRTSLAWKLTMATFRTITATIRFRPEPIKGSRFIATATPVASSDEAQRVIADITSEMPDATHHCWGWSLHDPERSRSSDDGEPGGSAGRPILAQIQGHKLTNIVVVVTRYFGGTKLGVGGLIRAYGGAAGMVLDRACVVEVEETTKL